MRARRRPAPEGGVPQGPRDFKLEESFDVNAQYHMFRVDPLQTNRVWFHTRTLGKHVADSKLVRKGDGKEIVNPPQCMHMDFTADGLVKEVRRSTLMASDRHARADKATFGRRLRVLLRRQPRRSHPGNEALQAVEALAACSSSSASSRASSPRTDEAQFPSLAPVVAWRDSL